MVKLIRKISNGTDKVTMVLACVFMTVVVVSSALQVFTRYVLNASLSWTEECCRYCFIWASMMGAAVAYKRGSHVALDIISGRLKGKVKSAQIIVSDVLVIAFCVILICYSPAILKLTMRQLSTAMRIPMVAFYVSIPLGALDIVVHAVANLLETITGHKATT